MMKPMTKAPHQLAAAPEIANGVRGRATLEAVQPTSLVVHNRPELRMQLRLQLPGRPPYLITHKEVVPANVCSMIRRPTPFSTAAPRFSRV